jgi:hypothetical protein
MTTFFGPPYHLEWIPWMREPAFAFGKYRTVLVYDVALVNPSYLAGLIDKRSPTFPAHVILTAKAALLAAPTDDREGFRQWCAGALVEFANQPAEVYPSPTFAQLAPPAPPAPPAPAAVPSRLPAVELRRFELLDIPDEPAPPAPSPKKRK